MAPTRPVGDAAPHAREEAERSLRLLRHHGELLRDRQASPPGRVALACRARAQVAATSPVADDEVDPEAVSASDSTHRPSIRHLANGFFDEPDAGNLHVRIRGGPARKLAGLPDQPQRTSWQNTGVRALRLSAPPTAPSTTDLSFSGSFPERARSCTIELTLFSPTPTEKL